MCESSWTLQAPFLFDARDHFPLHDLEFNALDHEPYQYAEWNGSCACGKVEMDGKRCALGASHKTLAMYKAEIAIGEFF